MIDIVEIDPGQFLIALTCVGLFIALLIYGWCTLVAGSDADDVAGRG